MAAVIDPGADTAAHLLPLALSRPHEAARRARLLLQQPLSPLEASYARQAIGIVLRETGDAEHAVLQLRAARSLARRSGAPERESDVLATLGVALAFAGRTAAARRALDAAVAGSQGLLN
ncbi:MAG TPA: hypothetical protein VFP72_11915, partial [Kineosporiaceae bacterium]|nr:hypothetical protein [Kineosporiaceae bacterium]